MRKLTVRQRAFVLEYRVDGNASRAAIAAGYSRHAKDAQGKRLLKVPAIREFLETFSTKDADAAGLSREFVIKGLMDITQSASASEKGRLDAFKQLAKFLGPQIPSRILDAGVKPKEKVAPAEPIAVHVRDEGDDMRSLVAGAVKH